MICAVRQPVVVFVVACAVSSGGCGRAPLCPEATFDQVVAVPSTSANITPLVERFSAHTTSPAGGVSVSIADNRGTVSFEGRGPIPSFVYSRVPYPAIGRTLYSGLGIADGVWFPFWLYCDDGGRLTEFFGEMSDRDLSVLQPVDGTCEPTSDFREMALDLPAHTLRRVALSCGFSVTAPPGSRAIDLGSSRPGTIDVAGSLATVLPFHTVDCRVGCGTDAWFELHAIVSDPAHSSVSFGIFYLDEAGVRMDSGLALPAATPLRGIFPNAAWTLAR